MPSVPSTGYKIIVEDRRYEDYMSMKQWFRNSRVIENIFSVSQDSAVTTTIDGSDVVIGTQKTSAAVVFLMTETDDGTQDLKKVWVTYQDDTGAIHGPIQHLIHDTGGTDTPVPLGHQDLIDTCASVAGDVLTMTALDLTENQLQGWYSIGVSGNGDQIGVANLIISNTASATVPEITLTNTPDANTATDVMTFQQFPCNDFFRMREMYCEVAPTDDAQILLCDFNNTVKYAAIAEDSRYSAHSNFFTQPTATCRSFLGRVKAVAANTLEAAAATSGQIVSVTFTPITAHALGGAADITMSIEFTNTLDWQPCIELQPATDVIVSITDTTTATSIHVEVTCLEVYPI